MAQLTERQCFWLDHLKACQAQDLSLPAYAEAERLSLSSLYAWRRKLQLHIGRNGSMQSPSPFVPVELSGPSGLSVDCRIDLPNGMVLHWPLSTSPDPLRQLLPILADIAP